MLINIIYGKYLYGKTKVILTLKFKNIENVCERLKLLTMELWF